MTKTARPTTAPESVPVEAAYYLDRAAEELSAVAADEGFTLKPYESVRPGQACWHHGLYGTCRDRELCILVVADERMAAVFSAELKGYVRLYPHEGVDAWLLLETRRTDGMTELIAATAAVTDALRLACVWRMPHPTDPDPKS